jgi:WD40 repeat protein
MERLLAACDEKAPQRVRGGFYSANLAVSPDGGLVGATPLDGQILLLEPAKGTLVESFRGHLIVAGGSAFPPDGSRLFSTYGGQEAVKLWDVGTHHPPFKQNFKFRGVIGRRKTP